MEAERTTHRGVNAQGRPVLYYNVWRYECPNGCSTATLDFSEASLDPEGRHRGYRVKVQTTSQGQAVLAAEFSPSFLDRLDLSFVLTVLGLVFGYGIFAWALVVIPASPMGKIVCAAALTIGALYVVAHLTSAPGRNGKGDVVAVSDLGASDAADAGEETPSE